MSHLERLLECLATPFVDPKKAISEWKLRKGKKIVAFRQVGTKRTMSEVKA